MFRKSEGGRHPGGRTCNGAFPMALVLTVAAMWRHRSELREIVRHG